MRVVVLENAVIDALAADPTIAATFPGCLGEFALAERSKCGSCGRAGAKAFSAYNQAKTCLATGDSASREQLKRLLRADQVKTVIRTAGGAVETLVF